MPPVCTAQQLCSMKSVGQRDHLTDIAADTTHAPSKLAVLLVNDHWQPTSGGDHNQPGTVYSGLGQTLQPVALHQHCQDDFDLHDGERGANTHPRPGTEGLIFKNAR